MPAQPRYVNRPDATPMHRSKLCRVDDAVGLLSSLSMDATSRDRLDMVSVSLRTAGGRAARAGRSLFLHRVGSLSSGCAGFWTDGALYSPCCNLRRAIPLETMSRSATAGRSAELHNLRIVATCAWWPVGDRQWKTQATGSRPDHRDRRSEGVRRRCRSEDVPGRHSYGGDDKEYDRNW